MLLANDTELKKSHHLLTSSGFSLVEMMIVFGLVGIGMLGLISLSSNQIKLNKTMSDNSSINELRNIISQITYSQDICTKAAVPNPLIAPVIDLVAASTNVQSDGYELSFATPSGTITKDSSVMSDDLTVRSFRVNNAVKNGTDPSLPLNDMWTGQLWLLVEHNGDVFGAKRPKERFVGYINMSVVKTTSELTYCNSQGMAGAPPSTNIIGSCPSGQVVTGLTSTGVTCSPVAATLSSPAKSAWSPLNPGPGCVGSNCKAYDFGLCTGSGCMTNGDSCMGTACCNRCL